MRLLIIAITLFCYLIETNAQEYPSVSDICEISQVVDAGDMDQLNIYLRKLGMNESLQSKHDPAETHYFRSLGNGKTGDISFLIKGRRVGIVANNTPNDRYEYYFNLLSRGAKKFEKLKNGNYFFVLAGCSIELAFTSNQILVLEAYSIGSLNPTKKNSSGQFELNATKLTNIYLKKGEKVELEASGYVTLGFFAGGSSPEGIDGYQLYNLVGSVKHGCLVAKVGETGNWIYIGKGTTLTADVDGYLKLFVNDKDPGNNTGKFTVKYQLK